MNKELIVSAILSGIHLISNELESIDDDGLRIEFELTLTELELALKELTKEQDSSISDGFTPGEAVTNAGNWSVE